MLLKLVFFPLAAVMSERRRPGHTHQPPVHVNVPTAMLIACRARLQSPTTNAALMSEGILVTPTMMAHHRLFVLADAFKASSLKSSRCMHLRQRLPFWSRYFCSR